jgi:dienelactone hydrolase
MGTKRLAKAALAVVLALTAGACSTDEPPSVTAGAPPAAALPPPGGREASYPVGLRVLRLHRGRTRPLTTLVFYPAAPPLFSAPFLSANRPAVLTGARASARNTVAEPASAGNAVARRVGAEDAALEALGAGNTVARSAGAGHATARRAGAGVAARLGTAGRPPADGRFPLVLFSHGLSGSAERYAPALASWAAAGFVVAAPTFPYTSEYTTGFRRPDIVNQPADVRYVLRQVRRLDVTPGDPLRGRIDGDHVAAVGHSAGGYTTAGLFTAGHDPRLRAGVIMAGWLAPGAFAGSPATILFLQGTSDPIVPVAVSRAVFDRVPWPKSYLLLRHNSHSTYLQPGAIGYAVMDSTVINFLRWTLKGDTAARSRLPRSTYPAVRTTATHDASP